MTQKASLDALSSKVKALEEEKAEALRSIEEAASASAKNSTQLNETVQSLQEEITSLKHSLMVDSLFSILLNLYFTFQERERLCEQVKKEFEVLQTQDEELASISSFFSFLFFSFLFFSFLFFSFLYFLFKLSKL